MNYARILRMAQSGVVGACGSAQPGEEAGKADGWPSSRFTALRH
jgi:hypothetical protein